MNKKELEEKVERLEKRCDFQQEHIERICKALGFEYNYWHSMYSIGKIYINPNPPVQEQIHAITEMLGLTLVKTEAVPSRLVAMKVEVDDANDICDAPPDERDAT